MAADLAVLPRTGITTTRSELDPARTVFSCSRVAGLSSPEITACPPLCPTSAILTSKLNPSTKSKAIHRHPNRLLLIVGEIVTQNVRHGKCAKSGTGDSVSPVPRSTTKG